MMQLATLPSSLDCTSCPYTLWHWTHHWQMMCPCHFHSPVGWEEKEDWLPKLLSPGCPTSGTLHLLPKEKTGQAWCWIPHQTLQIMIWTAGELVWMLQKKPTTGKLCDLWCVFLQLITQMFEPQPYPIQSPKITHHHEWPVQSCPEFVLRDVLMSKLHLCPGLFWLSILPCCLALKCWKHHHPIPALLLCWVSLTGNMEHC